MYVKFNRKWLTFKEMLKTEDASVGLSTVQK